MTQQLLALVALFGCMWNVHALNIDKVSYMTSGDHNSCEGAAVTCSGGFEREFLPNVIDATYVIPQVLNVQLMYTGSMTGGKHVAIVQKTGANPCTGASAAAVADSTHSGAVTADANKVFTVQSSALLDASKVYTVCYSTDVAGAAGAWTDTSITLKVSKIESVTVYGRAFKTQGTIPHHASLTMSYEGTVLAGRWISFVDATLNNNNPCDLGSIAAAPLDSSHSGSMAGGASTKVFTANTGYLSATKLFAVCYTESGGITSSLWRDSGIRLYCSAVKAMEYGVDLARFGDGFMRQTYNRNTNDVDNIPTDTFPQVANAKLRYNGELAVGAWISLVDASLNAEGGVGNPCAKPVIAAAAADDGHTGAFQGDSGKIATIAQSTLLDVTKTFAVCYATGDGTTSDSTWADSYARFSITKVEALTHHSVEHVTTGVLPRTGAISYETLDIGYTGSLTIVATTKISFVNEAIDSQTSATGVTVNTPCRLEASAETVAGATASGPLDHHASLKRFDNVDTTGLNTGDINPTTHAFTPYVFAVCYTEDGSAWHDSGIRLTVGKMESISYGDTTTDGYSFGSQRVMKPVDRLEGTTMSPKMLFGSLPGAWTGSNDPTGLDLNKGLASARNVIAQVQNQEITYTSTITSTTDNTELGNGRYMSLVDASLNGNKPCGIGSVAAAAADTLHSGVALAAQDTDNDPNTADVLGSTVTIKQMAAYLDHTKVFAVCYAITSGSTSDASWADSYVRVTISKISKVSSIGVNHRINALESQIASRREEAQCPSGTMRTGHPSTCSDYGTLDIVTGINTNVDNKLDLTYEGQLGDGMKLSIVDDTLNAGYPCSTATAAGGIAATGGPQAPGGGAGTTTGELHATVGKTVLAITNDLTHASLKDHDNNPVTATVNVLHNYAFCYSDDNGVSWYDTGIRVTRSPIYSMLVASGYDDGTGTLTGVGRHQTSVFLPTNRLASKPNVKLTYVDDNKDADEVTNNKWINMVSTSRNNGNPCVSENEIESTNEHGIRTGTDGYATGFAKASLDGSATGNGKVVLIDGSKVTSHDTVAVCYALTDPALASTVWKDTYIRLQVSQIAQTSMMIGQWLGPGSASAICTAGQTGCNLKSSMEGFSTATGNVITGNKVVHITEGRLPQKTANDHGLDLTFHGTLGANAYVSFVDASLGATTTHGIVYSRPCDSAAIAAAAPDSTHSGPLAASGVGFCQSVDPVPANRGSICDTNGDGAFTDACVLNARCNPTNDGSNGGCGNAGHCGGSTISGLDTTALDTTKTYALCYTTTASAVAAPTGDTTDTWADSGIRYTFSKISNVLTSSRHPGVAARIQTSIFKPTNRLPALANMRLTYVGTLAGSKYVSIVDADAASGNPCVKAGYAATPVANDASGTITAASTKNFLIPQGTVLSSAKTFAVCYDEDAVDTNGVAGTGGGWWLDSGIRFGVTDIEAVRVTGIDIVTTGQVPNTENGLEFTYSGALAGGSQISLVDETVGDYSPCNSPSAAGTTPVTQYSGVKTATVKDVTTMDTRDLDTSAVFALCYASGGGGVGDTSWADSGIRVTVPKVWNVLADSGHQGPACDLSTNKLNAGCKLDTKPRDMTSQPLATNRIPKVNGASLTYVGTLANQMHISIVDHMLNPSGPDSTSPDDSMTSGHDYSGTPIGNPCVNPAIAAQNAGTQASGVARADAGSKMVTFPNMGGMNLMNGASVALYAVCYAEGTGTTAGTYLDTTWKDSYIRLQLSEIHKFVVKLPHMLHGTTMSTVTTVDMPIYTTGQIANQAPSEQITYTYEGALATGKHVSLVDATVGTETDVLTGQSIDRPCTKVNTGVIEGGRAQTSNTHSGPLTATGNVISTVDSTSTKMDPEKIYALCYSGTTNSDSTGAWRDSGIRITVPALHTMNYIGTNGGTVASPTIAKRIREMTSIHLATNRITHAVGNTMMTYAGTQLGGVEPKYVSIVATDAAPAGASATSISTHAANLNPCVNPAVANLGAGSTSTGVVTGDGGKVVTFSSAAASGLDATKMYAVCYSTTNTGVGDINWRDSYIRLGVSEIESINTYLVNHLTTGQIPNHPNLKMDYVGSLATGKYIKLIDANLQMVTMGSTTFPMPCTHATHTTASPDSAHSNAGQASGASKTAEINTSDLDVYTDTAYDIRYWEDMGASTKEKYYAVCYGDSATGAMADTGIRLTVPQVFNMQFDSGYSDTATVCLYTGGANIGNNCDKGFEGANDVACAKGLRCTPGANNGGCGDGGKCGYMEICTKVAGTNIASTCDVNKDGVFDEPCAVNALCQNNNVNNGGCGTNGVCARQGTPVRNQMAWNQVDGTTITETPTNRLPQVDSMLLTAVPHPSAHWSTGCTDCFEQNDFISIVDSSQNSNNPCTTLNTASVAVATTDSTVKVPGVAGIFTVPQTTMLDKTKTFAVCYATGDGSGTDETWRDSYVRLKISLIEKLITVGVEHRTTGQVPNVVPSDTLRYTYAGNLQPQKWISLVDETYSSGLPCTKETAGLTPAGSLSAWTANNRRHTGVKVAPATKSYINDFDTSYLDTSKTFAVCYAEVDGAATDTTWADSGIRVTLPKLYNVEYSSGVTGVARSTPAATYDGVCRPSVACPDKIDTKPRSMTSNPLSTNRWPKEATASLTYHGELLDNKYVSIVSIEGGTGSAAAKQKLNPCVLPWFAGGASNTQATGPKQATSRTVSIDQATSLSDTTKTYAICYADYGTDSDHTWRDSYIRVKLTEVNGFRVMSPSAFDSSGFVVSSKTLKTVGQVPYQAASEQVYYDIIKATTLAGSGLFSLVHSDLAASIPTGAPDLPNAVTGFTGIENADPCGDEATADQVGSGTNTAKSTAVTVLGTDRLNDLDTSGLDGDKTYALCYAPAGTTAWRDSGIQITVSNINALQYIGTGNNAIAEITERTRVMTSIVDGTNMLPQMASEVLTYVGTLGNDKYISIVDASLNGGFPCENPTVASATADSQHSGVLTASGGTKDVTVPQSSLLDASKTFAACYAAQTTAESSTGLNRVSGNHGWRDTFIRFGVSKIGRFEAHGVTSATTGQIPSHPELDFTFTGTFAGTLIGTNGMITLVDANSGTAASTKDYPCPCCTTANAYQTTVGALDGTFAYKSGSNFRMDTTSINSSPILAAEVQTGFGTPAAGGTRYFAVCYTEGNPGVVTSFTDSGIRVSVPEFVNIQRPSGYGTDRRTHYRSTEATNNGDGSAWRDMTSEPLPTNRLAAAQLQTMYYVVSESSNGCKSTGAAWDPTCALSNNKYISIVDASLQNANPCVRKSIAETPAGTTATGIITASVGAKDFSADGSGLDDTKTFAICYSKGDKLADPVSANWGGVDTTIGGTTGAPLWRDTYIRVKISQISSLVTLGVIHKTYGQVPNVVPTDKIDFIYDGTLAAESTLSLVVAGDNTNNRYEPCTTARAATQVTGVATGSTVAGKKKCVLMGASPTANCRIAGAAGTYAEVCALNAECDTTGGGASGGCGTGGLCLASVSTFNTHLLSTSPTHMTMHLGAGKHTCQSTSLGGSNICDADFNGVFNEACNVGSFCDVATATGAANGGCGTNGVCSYTANQLTKGGYHAVCYKPAGTSTWHDSGIRVTVPKIYNVQLASGYVGTPPRDLTSLYKSTNRIPRENGQVLTYFGDLATNKHLSVVDASQNNNNPCVKGEVAGAAASGAGVASGVMTASGTDATLNPTTSTMTVNDAVTPFDQVTYAICYDEEGGTPNDKTWLDSYIRIQLSQITSFSTKGVTHRTVGAIPHHKATLTYNYHGPLAASQHIALVDDTINALEVAGFDDPIATPCGKNTGNNWEPANAGGSFYSGKHTDASGITTLDTTGLDTSKTYALCYSEGAGDNTDNAKWKDSGIRLTISQIDTIHFSGYTATEAYTRGKKSRAMTSVLNDLQAVGDEVALVLPSMANMPLRYAGDLGHSKWVSIVDVTTNNNNPCANPVTAAPTGQTARSCISVGALCQHQYHGDGASSAENSEVVFALPVDPGSGSGSAGDITYTLCYAQGLTSTDTSAGRIEMAQPYYSFDRTISIADTTSLWRDSYIRFTVSAVNYADTTGVRHMDHGHLANHEFGNMLPITISSLSETLGSGGNTWLSLVDETDPSSTNLPCATSASAAGSADTTHTGAYRGGAYILHYIGTTITNPDHVKWGEDWSDNTVCSGTCLDNTMHRGEPFESWGVGKTTTEVGALKTLTDPAGFAVGVYAVEETPSTIVLLETAGLDTTKQFALCYSNQGDHTQASVTTGNKWSDAGIRFTLTKIHTLRDNRAQLPILRVHATGGHGTAVQMSKFARDMTSSRAKVGRNTCLVTSAGALSVCDGDGDGVYNELCAAGAFCDPDAAVNGGCGTTKATCGSGLGVRAQLAVATSATTAVWSRTVYNQDTINGHHHMNTHKIRTPSTYRCSGIGAGAGIGCDTNNDGIFDETCASANDPCDVSLNSCGTGETCDLEGLKLEVFGDIALNDHVSLQSTSQNQGDPCALPATAAAGASSLATAVVTLTSELSANGAPSKVFTIAGAEIGALDTSKTYTLCYATGDGTGSDLTWRDSYIRVSVSQIEYIRSHQITHRTQGHIANSDKLDITYGGTLATGAYVSLVAESTNDYFPCANGATAGASAGSYSSGAVKATGKTAQFNTQALSTEVNFAVCYSVTGGNSVSDSWSDSGIRVTVSRITQLQYNKQSSPNQAANYETQQSTVDYTRVMPSTNAVPASNTIPIATNRIAGHGVAMDMEYNGNVVNNGAAPGSSIIEGQFIALVDIGLSAENNPCATPCDTSAVCTWDDSTGVLGDIDTQRSGVTVGAGLDGGSNPIQNRVVKIDQTGTQLLPAKTYAVCYGLMKSVDSQTFTYAKANLDPYSFRDSYIRLKGTKVHTLETYGIQHYTHGDIPSKAALTVSVGGSLAGSGFISLVDQTLNTEQPCVGSEASVSARKSVSITQCAAVSAGNEDFCDVNNDGVFEETCALDKYCSVTTAGLLNGNGGCGTTGNCAAIPRAVTTTPLWNLQTTALDSSKTYAVCYTEGDGSASAAWEDAGIRVQVPKVQSITYGAPARVIDADACFSGTVIGGSDADGIASCRMPLTIPSTAHVNIGSILPRAEDVSISYQGDGINTLASTLHLSLVEQVGPAASVRVGKNNPCRDAAEAAAAANSQGSDGINAAVVHPPEEGGMRLKSGSVQAAGSVVVIPQTWDGAGGTVQNRLDYTKTYAVCYAEGAGDTSDTTWRDSYVRVTLRKIKTLSMVHTGHPATQYYVTTVGTYTNVPSLELEWDGSLLYNQYLRLTLETENSGAPCDASNHDQAASTVSTAKVSSLTASKRLTFDTSGLDQTTPGYFAVCYAEGDGSSTDTTWMDAGLRIRFIRWTNPAKHRVVSGAPVRITFRLSTGLFDNNRDKVVLMKGETDCLNAPAAAAISDGSTLKRTMDNMCTAVGGGSVGTNCDSDFDGVYDEACSIGAMCNPSNTANGGCGLTGICDGAIQLPTGKQYVEIQDTAYHSETRLQEGNYAICVCLGSSLTGTAHTPSASSYGPANGDGNCDHANEFTMIFASKPICVSSGDDPNVAGDTVESNCDNDHDGNYNQLCAKNSRCEPTNGNNGGCGDLGECRAGVNLKVISEPQIGRYASGGVGMTARHAVAKSQKYDIKTTDSTAGYQVDNNDKIFFVPQGVGCGYETKFSGAGSHTYDFDTNSYISTGVDRRWRAMVRPICHVVDGLSIGTNCDSNGDGVYTDTCVEDAFCDPDNSNNGGCGSSGTCGSVVPAADAIDRTSPLTLHSAVDLGTSGWAATFNTPSTGNLLTTPQMMTACFATQESLAGIPADGTDFVEMTYGLEVVATPRLGPVGSPQDRVFMVEGGSPSFKVNSMKSEDAYYFMPHIQSNAVPEVDACVPELCTAVGGSNVDAICDSDWDGNFDNTCEFMAKCDSSSVGSYNGGCGSAGVCEQKVPTVHTSKYTGLILGDTFSTDSAGNNVGHISLPTTGTKLMVPAVMQGGSYASAWRMAACYVPAGAKADLVSNVKQLDDSMVVFKEPTDSLIASWFQGRVYEMKFTQPQHGAYGSTLATGLPGDIIVLKKGGCTGVAAISASNYAITGLQEESAKIVLEEHGGETTGDEKGGTAREMPLAYGKVNELPPGVYSICYATYASEGDQDQDFTALTMPFEILQTPATHPAVTAPRSIILGQDIVVAWSSNIGYSSVQSEAQSWLGLFPKTNGVGDCPVTNDCYISYQFIAARENTGTVIFSQSAYKNSGEYEIRYFSGGARNGQGYECTGITGVPSETYINCNLYAEVTSDTIRVRGQDIDEIEDLSISPGLEAVFGNGNRGRYHRTKLT